MSSTISVEHYPTIRNSHHGFWFAYCSCREWRLEKALDERTARNAVIQHLLRNTRQVYS